MRRFAGLVILVLGLALVLPASAEPQADPYHNARFGFSLAVPAGFVAGEPPVNGDGLTFTQRSGTAVLKAWGWNNALLESTRQALHRTRAECGHPIAYQKLGGNWFVLSWTDGRTISYHKTFLGPGSGASFLLTYPVARKTAFDPIVARLERSFRPGDLSEGH